MAQEPYLLLMTACIDPSTGPGYVVRADPKVRLNDYLQALRHWLAEPSPLLGNILLLENSGYALDELRRVAADENPLGRKVEFVAGNWNQYPPENGYGAGELLMIEQGLAQSELLKQTEYFVKVTGRLTFPTLPGLLQRLRQPLLFAVDSRDNRLFVKQRQKHITTQLMVFNTDFYRQRFSKLSDTMIAKKYFCLEDLFWDELIAMRGQPGTLFRWPLNVDAVGQAAHWQKDYQSPKQRLRNAVRGMARMLTPNWWI